MKASMTLVCIVLCVNCYSQVDVREKYILVKWSPDLDYYDTIELSYDTIPIVMLICDTFSVKPFGNRLYESSTHEYTAMAFPVVYWQFGYEVKRLMPNGLNFLTMPSNEPIIENGAWQHILYLDRDKKPLSKNIIVWQSIELKTK